MSSSTSSSDQGGARGARSRWPLALAAAIALAVCVESLIGATATLYMESQPLIYETKLAALDGELRGDIVFLGDSTTVAAVRPADLDAAVPPNARIVNLALPGSGPVVGEYLLGRVLMTWPESQPRLVVLGFSTLSFTEWRSNFVEYPLTHLLPFGPVARAAWTERDLGYLLEWTATRLPSLRHREEIKSFALSLVFDRWPALGEAYRSLAGDDRTPGDDARFRWNYTQRIARNRELAEALIRERGWRLFEEMRLPEGVLDPGVRFDAGAFAFPPFQATPREEEALARLLILCSALEIPVLVLPAAQPTALDEALALAGGAERIDAFEQTAFADRSEVARPLGLRLPWPHHEFADLAHVNESGLARYGALIRPLLHEQAAALR